MKVIFCLPGKEFSGKFLVCWSELLSTCIRNGIDIMISQKYNSNVYYVRPQCLGADVLRGPDQKPFNGKIDYDYIMWIDSDQIFKPDHFFELLSHQQDIVSGLYLMEGGKYFAAVKDWDADYFKTNGSFKFLEHSSLPTDGKLLEVAYSGFGFMLIKRGVFESMKYPWFEPRIISFENGVTDFASEDASFCLKARENGYKIFIDPNVIVGHEKSIVY